MTLERLIRSRRMTRSFDTTPIDLDELDSLLDLARRAPSAGFSQGSHFLVLSDDSLRTFWDVTGAGGWFEQRQPGVLQAPVVVLALGDEAAYTARYSQDDKAGHGLEDADGWNVPHWLTDTAMAVQQLLLLVEEKGWGALYFGIFRGHADLMSALGVPAGVVPVGAVAIGRRSPADRPSGSATTRPRRPLDEVVHRHNW